MKVIDWRNGETVIGDSKITKIEFWGRKGAFPDDIYGAITTHGYLFLISKEEIERLWETVIKQ